jgi:hypothetical protein
VTQHKERDDNDDRDKKQVSQFKILMAALGIEGAFIDEPAKQDTVAKYCHIFKTKKGRHIYLLKGS